MPPVNVTNSVCIEVESRELLDERLDAAVRQLQQRAMEMGGPGILVVRHGVGGYSAALSQEVPFGVTYEAHL
jgi:hypothetical protein